MLKLYNTLNRRKETLVPLKKGLFTIYTCGPTVYRDAHIGNLRSYLMADWIRRVLLFRGHEIIHVKNITDVGHMRQEVLEQGEDKVIAAAIAAGKSPKEIADFYTERFLSDEASLNILPVNHLPKATDHITEMLEIADRLLEKGFAYERDGNVYFSVQKFAGYGRLSGNLHESQLQEAVRVEVDPKKLDPRDFTLWKRAEKGRSVKWPSRWGDGFPGWHIECSAMSMKFFGDTFDIHTGGVDNIFPHHEGEIAQSEAFAGRQVVNYWVHGQHLLADGVKMAKSSGNAFIIPELEDRGIDPMAFRYLCMTARYRTRLNFTFSSLKASERALNRLRRMYVFLGRQGEGTKRDEECEAEWMGRFTDTVENDLDLPGSLNLVWRLAESDVPSSVKYSILNKMDEVLGLGIHDTSDMFAVPDTIIAISRARDDLRNRGEFQKADSLRSQISENGYLVQDGHREPSIRKKDKSELREEMWNTISSSVEVVSRLDQPNEYEFTIGIVANGFPEDVERCIQSIENHSAAESIEVLLLDNGNDELVGRTLHDLSSPDNRISVIHADHPLGDGAAKNALMKLAQGRMFVLIDPSVEAKSSFLPKLGQMLEDRSVGVAGFAGLRTENMLHFHDGEGESGDMDAMQGYCVAIRREDISSVGLMRESFRFYRNLDIDFSFQFKEKGFRIVADSDLPLVLHEHRGWSILSDQERDELSRKNYGRFLKKWRERTDLLVVNAAR